MIIHLTEEHIARLKRVTEISQEILKVNFKGYPDTAINKEKIILAEIWFALEKAEPEPEPQEASK